MAKQESVNIEIRDENEHSKLFIMSQNIKGLSIYERAKAINKFLEKETKVLETCIENYLRSVFIYYGIIPKDGTDETLKESFYTLHNKGKDIVIYDRYSQTDERIIGERNNMTVILEDDILSAAMEIEIIDYDRQRN